jgi:hypothetical protein
MKTTPVNAIVKATMIAVVAASLLGCATQRMGSRDATVTLNSSQEGTAYLVTPSRYANLVAQAKMPNQPTVQQALNDPMRNYNKGPVSGKGVTLRIMSTDWVYIVVRDDGSMSQPVYFNPKDLGDDQAVLANFNGP